MQRRTTRLIWNSVVWISGVLGATMVFLATVPPAEARVNILAWLEAVGLGPAPNVLCDRCFGYAGYEGEFLIKGALLILFALVLSLVLIIRRAFQKKDDQPNA